jgi:biopolymer transport protein ExbD
MTFEQCPVELLLAPDPNRGNMHVYNFREWEISPNQFKRPGALQRFDAAEMPAEMRCRAAQANPRWLLITMTNESRFTWREVVNMCAAAFEAGFERVFLNTERRVTRFRFGNVAPLPPPRIETVPSYSVAEVLPVQPTGWRQGTGRGKKGEGMVQVWACLEGETAMDAEEIGYNRPAGIVIPGPEPAHTPSVICEYEIGSGGRTWYRGWECERIAGQISRIAAELRAQQTKNDVLLWIWANGKVPYGDIAPVVQAVSQTQWDPNGR